MVAFFSSLSFIEGLFIFSGVLGTLFFVLRLIILLVGGVGGGSEAIDSNGGDIASGSLMQDLDGNGIPDVLETDGLAGADIDVSTDVDVSADVDVSTDVDAPHDLVDSHDASLNDAYNNSKMILDSSDRVPIKAGKKFIEFSVQNICAFLMMFGWIGIMMTRYSGFNVMIALIGGIISGTFAAWIFTLINRSLMKLSNSGNKVITSTIGKKGSVYLRIPAEGSGQIQINVSGRLEICDAVSADKAEIPFGEEVQVIGINKDKVLIVTTKFLKTDIK